MIDTIVLTLKQNMFTINDHNRFEPSTKGLFDSSYGLGSRSFMTCKQNPTPSELKNGIYKPRLTLTKRLDGKQYQIMMKIEFSAPKLLFGNNFDELEDTDFDLLVSTLQQKLINMGVSVFTHVLSSAPVSAIHYSKNIKLANGLTPYSILKDIQKSNVTQRLDFNQTDFRNAGHSIKYHANSYGIAFYDKMKDMEQSKISEKRAIENENILQMSLFDELNKNRRNIPFELLRMELRLNRRQKIKQVLRLIGFPVEPALQQLFKKEIAQKALLYYLEQFEDTYPKTLLFKPRSVKDFIAQYQLDNPKAKQREVLTALGYHMALEELSAREIREMVSRYQHRTWYRLYRQMNAYSYPKNVTSPFKPLRDSIEEFASIKTVEIRNQISNNNYI